MLLLGTPTKPPAGAQIDRTHPSALGLAHLWPLNEGGGVRFNDVASGRHGTAVGGVTRIGTQGHNGSVQFDGSSGYIDCPDAGLITAERVGWSVSCWIYPRTFAQQVYWGRGIFGGGPYLQELAINGGFSFWYGSKNTATSTLFIPLLQWSHVVTVVGWSGIADIYVNGLLAEKSLSEVHVPAASSFPFRIGAYLGTSNYHAGNMDMLAFYNRPLSAVDVRRLFLEPYGMLRGAEPERDFHTLASNAPRLDSKWQHFWGWE